ncbi:hypothetical protein AzCIB_1228 [Azoarcus sp. CIB]|nr:hypothetical protein AzCIB_1228 [Azoarcus sp. CIB]
MEFRPFMRSNGYPRSLRGSGADGVRLPRIEPVVLEHLVDDSLQIEESPPHSRSRVSAMTDSAHPIKGTWQSRFNSTMRARSGREGNAARFRAYGPPTLPFKLC